MLIRWVSPAIGTTCTDEMDDEAIPSTTLVLAQALAVAPWVQCLKQTNSTTMCYFSHKLKMLLRTCTHCTKHSGVLFPAFWHFSWCIFAKRSCVLLLDRMNMICRKQQEAIAMHNPSIQKSSRRGNENEQTPIQRKAAARSHSTLEDSSRAEESPLARTSSEGIKVCEQSQSSSIHWMCVLISFFYGSSFLLRATCQRMCCTFPVHISVRLHV